jgi:uncharacterized membrane protein YozB (DUF420 family)
MHQQVTLTLKSSTAAGKRRRSGWFYICMSIVVIGVVIAGFGNSFYGTVTGTMPLSVLVNIHAAVFGAWLILFLVQTVLVATKRTAIHRRLGMTAAALIIVMLGVGYMTAIVGARGGFDLDGTNDPLGYMVFPLGDLVSFAILVGAGFWYRRKVEIHKRLMLLATVGPLMNAPMAHFFAHIPGLQAGPPIILIPMVALLFASAVYDRITFGHIHRVSLWGAVLLFAWGNLRALIIRPSVEWHQFAAWLIN